MLQVMEIFPGPPEATRKVSRKDGFSPSTEMHDKVDPGDDAETCGGANAAVVDFGVAFSSWIDWIYYFDPRMASTFDIWVSDVHFLRLGLFFYKLPPIRAKRSFFTRREKPSAGN